MQLVPEAVHAATGHTGTAAYARAIGGLVQDIVTDPTTYMWVGVGVFLNVMTSSPASAANESELLQAQRIREAGSSQSFGLSPQSGDQSTTFSLRPK